MQIIIELAWQFAKSQYWMLKLRTEHWTPLQGDSATVYENLWEFSVNSFMEFIITIQCWMREKLWAFEYYVIWISIKQWFQFEYDVSYMPWITIRNFVNFETIYCLLNCVLNSANWNEQRNANIVISFLIWNRTKFCESYPFNYPVLSRIQCNRQLWKCQLIRFVLIIPNNR